MVLARSAEMRGPALVLATVLASQPSYRNVVTEGGWERVGEGQGQTSLCTQRELNCEDETRTSLCTQRELNCEDETRTSLGTQRELNCERRDENQFKYAARLHCDIETRTGLCM